MGRTAPVGVPREEVGRETVVDHLSRWKNIGTVSENFLATHLQFGEFYILAPYRRQGFGTGVLVEALRKADALGMETRLEYLKWNPVGSLYARHGFKVVGENDIHCFLARRPNEV